MKNSFKNIFDIKKKIIIITGGAGFLVYEFSIAVSNVVAIPIILDKNQISINFLKKKFKKKIKRENFFQLILKMKMK